MNPSPKLRFVLALTACLSLGLAACSKDKPAEEMAPNAADAEFLQPPSEYDPSKFVPDGTKSADGQVTKDITKQTFPTDPFNNTDYSLTSNANDLFMHHCLKEKGVDSPKPKPDPPFKNQPSAFENPVTGEYIFNEQSAARDGYQQYSGDPGSELLEAAGPEDPFDDFLYKYLGAEAGGGGSDQESEQTTPEQKNYEECNTKFFKEFKAPGVDYTNNNFPTLEEQKKDPSHFALAFMFIETPYIKEKAKEWKACMQPLGIPDLPESPDQMPPESKDKAWHPENWHEYNDEGQPIDENGNVIPDDVAFNQTEVSAEEKAIATKDAQCRASSGWDRAVYDTKWGMLTDHMKENEAGIKEFMNEQKAYEAKLKAYIEKN